MEQLCNSVIHSFVNIIEMSIILYSKTFCRAVICVKKTIFESKQVNRLTIHNHLCTLSMELCFTVYDVCYKISLLSTNIHTNPMPNLVVH
jgi:hypothetical protein